MLKVNLLLNFLLLLATSSLSSQSSKLNIDIDFVGFDDPYGVHDTISRDHYYDNGRPHIVYKPHTDERVRRLEYFAGGDIKSDAIVKQYIVRDTSMVMEYPECKPMTVIITKLVDIPDGPYTEYLQGDFKNHVKVQGRCSHFRRVGTWTYFDYDWQKTVATFNSDGQLEGPFEEYYYNPKTKTYLIKVRGRYEPKTYQESVTPFFENVRNPQIIQESKRVGTWTTYSRDGAIIQEAIYTWKGKHD